jgi:predicted ATPase/DNA-binding XRE family transcriptional regulator
MPTEPLHGSVTLNQHRNQAGMATRDLPGFGDLLRRHRTAAALSQEELAERAGVSVRALSDLERGVHRAPRLETVRMLAAALGLGENERAGLLTAARPEMPPVVTMRTRPTVSATLPLSPTRLIGRESELASLSNLLTQEDVRLVTLTGPGGTGKTHLAQAVAAEVVGHFPDGVFFVDLSALTEPHLVMPTIAATLGVRETASEPLRQTIIRHLWERRLLLVLDNCEQVLESASDIATLLAACPHVAILATSREPLHIRAEREIAVAPLPLPDSDRLPALADLALIPAVALFVARAQAATADFTLTTDNAAAVAGICQRLEGLPLAIELAAARIKLLPPAGLLSRLEQRLPLLTGGGRDLPARQRTMRDAIAWSYDLLAPEEQRLFGRLSVFAGGCTLEAAEAMVDPGTRPDVLGSIGALIEQSLVRQIAGFAGEPRYQMLEIVREYGLEQLTLSGELDGARERHAAYFLWFCSNYSEFLWSVSLEWLPRVDFERDNVRLALAWFDEQDESDALLRMSAMAYGVWIAPGLYREGLRWVERALERSSHNASVGRSEALAAGGMMAAFQGEYARAAEFSDKGVAQARELADPLLVGQALVVAGFVSYRRGDYPRAEELIDDANRRLSELVNSEPAAISAFSTTLLMLGDTSLAQEQFDRAARRYRERLAFEGSQGAWGPIDARAGLAGVYFCTGNYGQAAALYLDSLNRARDLGILLLVASVLIGLAAVAATSGLSEEGAQLLGTAEAITASLGMPIFPRDQPVRDRCLSALMAALGNERLAIELEAGRRLTVEQAIAQAQDVADACLNANLRPGASLEEDVVGS